MGMCLPCLGGAADDVVVTPDPEARRQQLAEAAEKRQKAKFLKPTRKRHTKAVSRQHTGVLKIQRQLKGKGKNRRRWRNRQ
ncbi:small VCP/p97-interacting protein isoform X2 [Lampris incognitus]|uniref:small VCP/p97-interacting protein isoform X2 n=1 Tax=Lampris incognitus TaxID=2546036 RepID=UPI0024B515CA|nr:small VCP/p97-interacting protein isoform X2 [Lampris incognitus]